MERKESSAGFWIFSIVIVLFTWLVRKTVGLIIPDPYKVREVDFENTDEFAPSRASKNIRKSIFDEENVAELYEKLCVLEPVQYRNDPRIPAVLAKYKKVLKGQLLDKEGRHMPTPKLNGKLNPDYATYIRNQHKAFTDAGKLSDVAWLDEELKRVRREGRSKSLRKEYTEILLGMGVLEELLPVFLTDGHQCRWSVRSFVVESQSSRVWKYPVLLKRKSTTGMKQWKRYSPKP
jgi:hypothetical protein